MAMETWATAAPAARRQMFLPPVSGPNDMLETASARLIKGLRNLDTATPATTRPSTTATGSRPGTTGSERPMHAISRFGARANERVADAMAEMLSDFKSSPDAGQKGKAGPSSVSHDLALKKQKEAFEAIVQGIDSVLMGDKGIVRPVKRDEVVTETVSLHGQRHYKISLPSRPAVITFSISKQSGATLTLWASTHTERPNSKSYDVKGKDDKINYEHALLHVEEGEDGPVVDRRHAVPACRELFVTVEAEAGECSYSLKVQHSAIKIVLTKAEISSHIQKMKRGWETRLHELQREPAQREQFELHLVNLQETIFEKKREIFGSHDFAAMNVVSQIEDTDMGTKLFRLKKKALQRCAQQDYTKQRREIADKAKQEKLEEWMNRADARREAKLERERLAQEEEKLQEMQKDWLIRLAVATYAERLKQESLKARNLKRYLAQKAQAACMIHKFILRATSYKRRQELYLNIIRARMAFTAYVRHTRIGVFQAAIPIAQSFLETEGYHKDVPSLTGAVKRFKGKVIVLQRWWRGIRIVRNAYVRCYFDLWLEIQNDYYHNEAHKQALKEAHAAAAGSHAPGGRRNSADASAQRRTVSAPAVKKEVPLSPKEAAKEAKLAKEVQKTIEASQDQLPEYMAIYLLYMRIVQMQKSFGDRLKVWEEEVKKDEFRHDLEGFGVIEDEDANSDDDIANNKPRPVYLDDDELKAIVCESVDSWRDGGWKEIRHNRFRLLKKPWKAWAKFLWVAKDRAAMGLSRDDESPRRPHGVSSMSYDSSPQHESSPASPTSPFHG